MVIDKAPVDAAKAESQRHLVTCEGARRVTVDVAGELVEKDDQRQTAIRIIGPFVEPTGKGGDNGVLEPVADGIIEGRILPVPLLRQ